MKTSIRAYSSALWRPIRIAIRGFIRNPQAVLLLAACLKPKSDRLLEGAPTFLLDVEFQVINSALWITMLIEQPAVTPCGGSRALRCRSAAAEYN